MSCVEQLTEGDAQHLTPLVEHHLDYTLEELFITSQATYGLVSCI